MNIRPENEQDIDAIGRVTADAFAPMRFSDQTEHLIVAALRDAGALTISLVAVVGDEVVGHIAFSPVAIDGKDLGWFGLGPVSVRPELQGKGVGSALIRQGISDLRAKGAAGCVVLGNPDYYRRFGFENDKGLRYGGGPPDKFMRLAFGGPVPAGQVEYHASFGV